MDRDQWDDAVRYLRECGAQTTPAAGPTRWPDGKQLAPEKFARWLIPGIWEDTDGVPHVDVPEMLRLFKVKDTPENRAACARDVAGMLEKQIGVKRVEVRP